MITKPTKEACEAAAYTAELLAEYTKKTEPFATESIQQLEGAAEILYAEAYID